MKFTEWFAFGLDDLKGFFQTKESMILFCKMVHVTRDFWRSPGLASCSTQDQLGQVAYVQLGFESL